jgi:hypothetical protein
MTRCATPCAIVSIGPANRLLAERLAPSPGYTPISIAKAELSVSSRYRDRSSGRCAPGTVLADPATVIRRLRSRSLGLEPRRAPWEVDHLTEWLHVLAQPQFAQQIHADRQTVVQVADTIARSAGLAITPSTDGPLRAWLHRYETTVRNIHWN